MSIRLLAQNLEHYSGSNNDEIVMVHEKESQHVESVYKIAVSNVPKKDKHKCENCNEIINQSSIKKHVKNCKIYSKFSKITSTGFKCLVCYDGHYK